MEEPVDDEGEASSGLTDELSRRLNTNETQHTSPSSEDALKSDLPRHQPRLLCEERHDAGEVFDRTLENGIVSKWRQKEKLKTTAVALVLCLNVGVDPPDVIKISPCARLECWVDPMSMQPAKALEAIGKNLQAQYERWQPRAKYKMHLDPTVEDMKKLCLSCRRNAKNERVLLHYNGHGVPRPTVNGEIWVFNSRYTQYIPVSIYELQSWLGTPCIYVLDCSAAGVIINSFRALMAQRQQELLIGGMAPAGSDPLKDIIVLAACGAKDLLPQNPELPADVFTACLTTPIKVSLRWFCSRSLLRHDGITKELIDRIPGRQTDRKTPLGELNWIFTAITDTIAWNMLPRALFQKLFRSDLLVASLFRNFLLAERIMVAANCTPISFPRLPPTHQHPMWHAWDMAAEMCLMQLPTLLADPSAEFQPSTFFSEQLTAFELWLAHGSKDKKPPEQLPIVLQVLLSQVHRLRALVLLGRFLDMGPWAVDLALSVGIFPYVLKLLQTTSVDLRSTLVFIWCKILALDKSCQVDLVKDSGQLYFIKYLDTVDGRVDLYSRAQASFVLSVVCDGHPKGQALCVSSNLLAVLLKWLRSMFPPQVPFASPGHALLLKWLCLCLGKLCQDMAEVSLMAIREGAADLLVQLLTVASPEIRAAAVFGLGCLVHSCPERGASASAGSGSEGGEAAAAADVSVSLAPSDDRLPAEQLIANAVRQVVYDPCVLVRCELAVLYARVVRGHRAMVQEALQAQQKKLIDYFGQTGTCAAGSRARTPSPSLDTSSTSSAQHDAGLVLGTAQDDANALNPMGGQGVTMMPTQAGAETHGEGMDMATTTQDQQAESEQAAGGAPAGHSSYKNTSTYNALLESIQMLALDPSPKVAKLGRSVLKIAGYELNFVGTFGIMSPDGPASSSANGSSLSRSVTAGSSVSTKFQRSSWGVGRSAHSGIVAPRPSLTARASVPNGTGAYSSGPVPTAVFSPPPSPLRDQPEYSRHPFLLLPTNHGVAEQLGHLNLSGSMECDRNSDSQSVGAGSSYGTAAHTSNSQGGVPGQASSLRQPLSGAPSQSVPSPPGPIPQEPLPVSHIYKSSSEYFSRPMLEPMASAWRETDGSAPCPWTAPVDAVRRSQRLADIEGGISRCKAMTSPKLREQVYTVETGCDSMSALCFHPYYPIVCLADAKGFIRITNYNDSQTINMFHTASGTSDSRNLPSQISFLRQLNDANGPVLLAGSADGAVRVWRSYTMPNQQRMATALQAVTIHVPPAHGHPTAFEWNAQRAQLFAAGGSHPEMVYCWDLQYEMCSNMIPMSAPGGAGGVPSVERIVLGQSDSNLLLASCSDSVQRIFDVRNARAPVVTLQPFREPCAGVVLEHGQNPSVVVAGSEKGELVFMDMRMAGSTGSPRGTSTSSKTGGAGAEDSDSDSNSNEGAGVGRGSSGGGGATSSYITKTVQAHSGGGMCAFVPHSCAPLLATATTARVIKVWTDKGDLVGATRAQSSHHAQRLRPATCLSFHPYQTLLAAGGGDPMCSVFTVDNVLPRSAATGQNNPFAGGPGSNYGH